MLTVPGPSRRRPIGIAVVGGLLFSTFFTLLVIPAVHVFIVRLGEKLGLNTIPPLIEHDIEREDRSATMPLGSEA